jgi:hypothetical protein
VREDFNYPPSSSNAQSVPINYRLSAEAHRIFEEIFYSRKFPYRTITDMHRHADHRLITWLNDQSSVKQNVDYLRAMNLSLNKESEYTAFQQIMDKLRIEVHLHLDHGDSEDASRIVNMILATLNGMPDGQMKTRHQARIMGEFGHLSGEIVDGSKVEALVSYDPEDMVEE